MIFNMPRFRICSSLITLLFIAGCSTQAPIEQATKPATGNQTSLSPAETKTYQEALVRVEQGEPGKALKALDKLAQAHPGQAGLWLNLAIAYYQDAKLDEALAALSRAQALDNKIPAVHNLAGLIAVDQGDYKSAESHYVTAIKLDQNFAAAHYNLALLYDIFYQDIRPAVEHYQHYLTLIKEEDKETSLWVEELKMTLKRRGEG